MATTVRIEPQILEKSAGFALDVGGSAAKIAYRSKDHHSGGKPKSKDFAGLVTVELVKDATAQKISDLVKERCDMTAGGSCFSTGSGANAFLPSLQESLGVSITNLGEGECFIKAMAKLGEAAKSPSDIFMTKPPDALAEADKQIQIFMAYQASLKDTTSTSLNVKPREDSGGSSAPEIKYPHVMVTCGSAISFILVEKDGTNRMLGMTNLGGRAFMGLTKAMTKAKDFDEVNNMMEGANGRTVDEWMSDRMNPAAKPDMYNTFPGDMVIYRLGKLNRFSLDEVKQEDVAQSIASLFAINASTLTMMHCRVLGVKNAYLCGNFVSNCPVFRFNFTANFTVESALNSSGEPINFEFLANGGHLGALGALMQEPPKTVRL